MTKKQNQTIKELQEQLAKEKESAKIWRDAYERESQIRAELEKKFEALKTIIKMI